jgi:hypothetical protein
MKVIIGGMGLSGSTLCYNIFRVLRDNSELNYEVIKIHEYNHAATMGKTIFMIRDLRDTVASMLRKDPERWNGDVEEASKYQMMWYYDTWKDVNKDIVWKYEEYKSNPYEHTYSAISKLGLNVSYDLVKQVIDTCENIKDMNIPHHQDFIQTEEEAILWETTKMSKKHITNGGKIGGYKEYLTEEQIRFIETKYKYFFEEQNYQLDY